LTNVLKNISDPEHILINNCLFVRLFQLVRDIIYYIQRLEVRTSHTLCFFTVKLCKVQSLDYFTRQKEMIVYFEMLEKMF